MNLRKNIGIYLLFIAASALFLILERLTHVEFFLHLAAIPVEVMVAVFIVEKFLERREQGEKRRQLMFIKSYLFRSDMRNLFITNFNALQSPAISFAKIRSAGLEELKGMRRIAERVEYKSSQAMESVVMEYVKAQPVWMSFMERAITYNFEEIFQDMIYILHFINDVRAFKEANPQRLFIEEAEKNEAIMGKVRKVLGDGVQRFLDYAIELREKEPEMFQDVLSDYEISSGFMNGKQEDIKKAGRKA
jgi:hypothetical protein